MNPAPTIPRRQIASIIHSHPFVSVSPDGGTP